MSIRCGRLSVSAGGRAGGGQGVPGPSPSVLAALGRMTQQPKQQQEESTEGRRRVEGGEHQGEETTEGRAGSTSLTSSGPGGRCAVGGAAGREGRENPCSPFCRIEGLL